LNSAQLESTAKQVGDETHAAIARRLRLCQSTVSRLLTGRTVPQLTTLLAMRTAYGISLDDLVLDDVEPAAETEAVAQ
jgi:transcriptional regulator with XRE-family HTH domain